MESRPLGRSGLEVPLVGICPGDGPAREAVVRRALERGCRLFWSGSPVDGALVLPGAHGSEFSCVRYNLLDQREAQSDIPGLVRSGRGVVATHVLAGGALASAEGRAAPLAPLVRPGRSLAQAALQFVLANERVSCAVVRVASPSHVDEVLAAPEAEPLSGRDLELIFEVWANRYG
jgi:aryl-alcohol dehydrogenase-like predicted oxidoreductase